MSAFHAIFSEWPYAVLFSVLQYISYVIVVPSCMDPTISTPLLFQKAVVISLLADRHRLYKLFGLVLWMWASTALTALWFQNSQTKLKFHHLLLVRCDWEIHHRLCGIALKSQTRIEAIFCVLCAPVNIFGTHLDVLRQSCKEEFVKSLGIHMKVLKLRSAVFHNIFGAVEVKLNGFENSALYGDKYSISWFLRPQTSSKRAHHTLSRKLLRAQRDIRYGDFGPHCFQVQVYW
jgi:hypothetical protein